MKRIGPVRDCDSKYLSGRPSFTISSWSETLNVKHSNLSRMGDDRTPGHQLGHFREELSSRERGKREQFDTIAKVYSGHRPGGPLSQAQPIWATEIKTKSTSPVMKARQARKTIDPYAATGSRFRQSTAGNAFTGHQAINIDGLTPAMQRQWKKANAKVSKGERGKEKWNRSPHYIQPSLPKLDDPLREPLPVITQKKQAKAKAHLERSYSTKPYNVPKPLLGKVFYIKNANGTTTAVPMAATRPSMRQSRRSERVSIAPPISQMGFLEEADSEDEQTDNNKDMAKIQEEQA